MLAVVNSKSGLRDTPRLVVRRLRHLLKSLRREHEATPAAQPLRTDWSIGIYQGASPLALLPLEPDSNPVLTRHDLRDRAVSLVADPFMLRRDGVWYMFFEALDTATTKGRIALATSRDGRAWTYERVVLAERFHLSYPYVFEWDGHHYMIPESYEARSVRLYRASRFPSRWRLEAVLLQGGVFLDPSVFRFDGHWWMFVETSPEHRQDTLRLYHADSLPGPWTEHPASPIVSGNIHSARPAGRVLVHEGRILRFAQDCYPSYGTQVRAFEVTELTPTRYREREVVGSPVLAGGAGDWNRDGMHHVDAHALGDGTWIACVDGWRHVETAT